MREIRSGMAIKWQGEVYLVIDFQHIHMGRGGASIRTKLKNVRTGLLREVTLRESDEVEEIRLEKRPSHFSYKRGEEFHFLDNETYEDIVFQKEQIENELGFLKEGMELSVLFADGEPIGIELPTAVELKVVETDPGLRGDTVSGGSKPAKLETGKVIQVPLFIQVGDVVKVDTRTGEYIERAK